MRSIVVFIILYLSLCLAQDEDIEDTHIQVVTIVQEPFVFYDSSKQGNDRFEDGTFGAKTSNGSWTGVIGELTNGNAEVGLSPLTITSSRVSGVEFTSAYLDIGLKILVRKPDEKRDAAGFLQPFHWSLWFLLVVTTFVISAVSFIVDYFSPYGNRRTENPDEDANSTYQNSLLGSVLIFVGQGGDVPKSWSSRILILAYFFFTMIIISSYTANLTAFLTVRRLETDIQSLSDLRKSQSPFGVVKNSAPASYFQNNENLQIQAMSRNIRLYDSTQLAVEALRKGDIEAFIHTSSILDYIANQKPCDSLQVGELFDKGNFGIALKHNSAYTKEFSVQVLRLRESGYIDDLYQKWYYDMGACSDNDSELSDTSTLYIADMAGLFYMLLVFIGIAGVVLAFEMWFWTFRVKDKIVDTIRGQSNAQFELDSIKN